MQRKRRKEEEEELVISNGADSTIEKTMADVSNPKEFLDVVTSVCAIELDDDDIAAGLQDDADDGPVDEPLLDSVVLPSFDAIALETIKRDQDDVTLKNCIDFLNGTVPMPSKTEALGLPTPIQDFLRHKGNFRITHQGVLIRLWLQKDSSVSSLIVVGDAALQRILKETHDFSTGSNNAAPHVGQRKTLDIIKRRFYAFKLREKVHKFIKSCAVCCLHKIGAASKEDDGNHIATENGHLLVADVAGPYAGSFASTSGRPRYVFVAVDAFSRYAFAVVMNSTADDEIFRALLEIRKQMSGLPSKISVDNALLRENSRARRFLEENGTRILHGLPTISRCQAKAERTIGTLSRLFIKYSTASPSTPINKLVEESVLTHNASPHEGLPNGLSPREVHFSRAPRSFLRVAPEIDPSAPPSIRHALVAARDIGRDVLAHDVATYAKRQEKRSPTNYAARLKIGDLAIQKRTSFPTNVPRKLCFKILVDAFEVKSRISTNAYRVESLISGESRVVAGDLLIRMRGLSVAELKELVDDMNRVAARNASRANVRITRSMATDAQVSSVRELFGSSTTKMNTGLEVNVSSLFS